MEDVSYSDLKAISNYLGLGVGGTRDVILARIRDNCGSPLEEGDESKDTVGETFDMPEFQRQMSDTVNKHGYGVNNDVFADYLFGTVVFLDLYDDDENDRFCLKIALPKTPSGIILTNKKIELYDELLKSHDRDTLIAHNLFIPTFHTTSGNLFVCELEIFDDLKDSNTGRNNLRFKTAQMFKTLLSPSVNGLFRLVKQVFSALQILLSLNFNINSLSMESILYSKGDFYISDFSSEPANALDYARVLSQFIDEIIVLYDNYFKQNNEELALITGEIRQMELGHEKYDGYSEKGMEAEKAVYQRNFERRNDTNLQKKNTDLIISGINTRLMPLISVEFPDEIKILSISSAFNVFNRHIEPLMNHWGRIEKWSWGVDK